MEQIEQLKAMRDAAKARIEALPDFRLMTSLTALIDDLEKALGTGEQTAEAADGPAAEPDAGEGSADSGTVASAAPVLAVAIAEPTAPAAESDIAAVIPEIDPVPVQAEPEPASEPEPEAEFEPASSVQLVAAAEALSDLDSLPSEEAIQVLEAVEEALTADISMQPDEHQTDEYEADVFDTEEQREEPVSYLSTLGLSESEEEAVNRALAELSVDLDEDLEEEPEPVLRPSVLRR